MRYRTPLVTVLLVAVLAACGSVVSPATSKAGKQAACSVARGRIDDMQASADVAKAVASLIRDVGPTRTVRDLAGQVADSPEDGKLRAQLSRWLRENCR